MPPKLHKKSRNLVEQEERILLAIPALKNSQIQSIRKAADDFRVPYDTTPPKLPTWQIKSI